MPHETNLKHYILWGNGVKEGLNNVLSTVPDITMTPQTTDMLKISLFAVGKLKERHWLQAQEEFMRRLKPYARIKLKEAAASPITGAVTPEQSMKEEAGRLIKLVPKDATVIALDRTGKELSSEEFAALLNNEGSAGQHLVFIVGGAAGLDPSVTDRTRVRLSLSKMTFTHEMARILLLEQLYRAITIMKGKKYHY